MHYKKVFDKSIRNAEVYFALGLTKSSKAFEKIGQIEEFDILGFVAWGVALYLYSSYINVFNEFTRQQLVLRI